jgi:PadR family transcriptional regulator, regulatory protein PadR
MPVRPAPIGEFEQLVLLALLRLGPDAYGATVCTEIEARAGRSASVSAVHTTLDRLESKGLVRSRVGRPTPQRGGKRKRHYALEPAGRRAVQHAVRTIHRMTEGLEGLLGETA